MHDGPRPARYITVGKDRYSPDPATRDRENRERDERWAKFSDAEMAAQVSMRQLVAEEMRNPMRELYTPLTLCPRSVAGRSGGRGRT